MNKCDVMERAVNKGKEELHFAGLFDNLQIVSLLTDLESLL